jgi:hypothetical protein
MDTACQYYQHPIPADLERAQILHHGLREHGSLEMPSTSCLLPSFPRKRKSSAVYVIAHKARDTMQTLDARFRGHDGKKRVFGFLRIKLP